MACKGLAHLTSLALANSWLQYLRDAAAQGLVRKKAMDTLQFQTDTAVCLLVSNETLERKRRRPSAESLQDVPKAPHNSWSFPANSVRLDGREHWPAHVEAQFPQRCQKPGCNSKSRVRCSECEVFLWHHRLFLWISHQVKKKVNQKCLLYHSRPQNMSCIPRLFLCNKTFACVVLI